MFKKLHYFFFALLSFFIISCNFTFNDPKTPSLTTSLTVSCGSGSARQISDEEKEFGTLSIYILGDKTNHYVHREGNASSTFYFDGLPADTYLIHADFYVSKILRATAEDFVEVKALQEESAILHFREVNTRYPSEATYPYVIDDWSVLKNHIESTEDYYIYVIGDMDITDKISITRKICLLAASPITLNCETNDTAFTVTNSSEAQLTIDSENNSRIIIRGKDKTLNNSLFVADRPLELNNVEVYNLKSKVGGGVITSRNHVTINNCVFETVGTEENGGVVFCDGGSLTVKGVYLSDEVDTKLINDTAFKEDFYLIANNNPVYTFEGVNMDGVTMYIQCNNKPTLKIDQNCTGNSNTLYFSSGEIVTTEEDVNMWKTLFNNITKGTVSLAS